MAKNKQKQQKKQPKQKKTRGRKQKQSMGSPATDSLIHAVCSNLNPFCPQAKGAKLFDDNANPSATYQTRDLIPLTSNAQGNLLLYLGSHPLYAYQYGTLTATAPYTVSAWGSAVSNSFYDAYTTNIDTYRVVSYGFRYKSTQALMDAQGTVMVVQCGEKFITGSTGQSLTSLSQGLNSEFTTNSGASLECVGRPSGNVLPNTYHGVTDGSVPGYTTFMLCFSGVGVNSQFGSVELVINYEWSPKEGPIQQLASKAAPSVPEVMTLRSNTASSMPLVAKFVDAATSDMSWMNQVAKNIQTVGNLGMTLASFTPYGRAAKTSMALGGMASRLMLGN